jgi:uncharacterized damage-inducible protein DinB
LSEAQFDQDFDYSIGSIHDHIAHMMGVEYWWFKFLSTGEPVFVTRADCETREAIRSKWDETEAMIRAYVSRLTADEASRLVKPPFWSDDKPAIAVYEALYQVAVHSADHRAQALSALHKVGGQTTPQDYLFYRFDTAGVHWENA